MTWLFIFIPVIAATLLLIFYLKKVVWWELAALIVPSAIIILLMNTIMVAYRTSDTEYFGNYITKVVHYEAWDEEVSCRHSYDCNCTTDKDGRRSCSTCYMHAYDVDYHPEYWTKIDNAGNEYEISKSHYDELVNRFGTKAYFVDMHRDYHSIDGDSYRNDWAGEPEKSDVVTTEHSYTNKIKASHSVFKFENIDEKTKKMWSLYDYPQVVHLRQQVVLGKNIDPVTDRKIQFINGFYGSRNQFRMYILFFKDKSLDVAFKQRSYWEGGNKNEFVICIGVDSQDKFEWVKCFSWMDKPELEVEVEEYFNDSKDLNLSKFADWLPAQIQTHWHRKQFKDFEYLNIELTDTQMWWVLIIVLIYNIIASVWIVKNEFWNERLSHKSKYDSVGYYNNRQRRIHEDTQRLFPKQNITEKPKESLMQKIRRRYYGE